jgi:hypothetical protein
MVNIANIISDDSYYDEVKPNIWLMDNHRWAYYIWELYAHRDPGKLPCTLIHIDYHWDDINDFQDNSSIEILKQGNINYLYNLVEQNEYLIMYDSFIAPAVIRGLFDKIYFYCFQDSDGCRFDPSFRKKYPVKTFSYKNINNLVKNTLGKNFFLDIDIDIFNNNQEMIDEGDLWSDERINTFIQNLQPLFQDSLVTTIAMSFGCSGTPEDTRKLTRMLLEKLQISS